MLDATFGPQLIYERAVEEQGQNLPPSAGLLFFGYVAIDVASEQMTVTLRDVADNPLWAKTFNPQRA